MNELIKRISEIGVIPVIKIDRASDAVPLARALAKGGLNAAEITFRTAAAEDAIKAIAAEIPEMLIIAGTVLTPLQADKAMAAGASAIVSPGTNPMVVDHCNKMGYPIIPGVCTPSEVEMAMSHGLSYLKFFPAEAAGGVKMISAMSAPYGNVRFMPTGGINLKNVGEYLTNKAVFACGGSWMVPASLINEGKFDEIEALARDASALVKEIRK